MNNEILLWHNSILGEYFSGTQDCYEADAHNYQKENLNVLYTMEASSAKVIDKIRNSLNSARAIQGEITLRSA